MHHTDTRPATAHNPADPGTGAVAQATTPALDLARAPDAMAVIVITVRRDRIEQTARLVMGGTHTAARAWERAGAGSWKSRDPEFGLHEERLGLELTEYMDALELPARVAAMLPRPASPDAVAKAAEEVRRG